MRYTHNKSKEHNRGFGIRIFFRPAGVTRCRWVPWSFQVATANHLFTLEGTL